MSIPTMSTSVQYAGFIADAAKIGLTPDPLTGEQVQTLIGELAKTPPATVARVRAALDQP